MEINRHNYELYLLDFIEGNLPDNIVLAMLAFLENNPDVENDANTLMESSLVSETIKFDQKNTLKKNQQTDIPGLSLFEQLSVSFLENDIKHAEMNKLNSIIQINEEKQIEHQKIQNTKLIPDLSIVFDDKNKLKHFILSSGTSRTLYYYAVAASILLVLGITLLFRQNGQIEEGKAFVYNNLYFKTRQVVSNQLVLEDKIIVAKAKIVNISTPDSFQIREKQNIQFIENKRIDDIVIASNDQTTKSDELTEFALSQYQQEKLENQIPQFNLKNKLKEKVFKLNVNEKVTFISVVNAFGRFTDKVFNKKLEIEKTTNVNGASLYAIKTETRDIYTLRNPRDKSKQKTSPKVAPQN